MKKEIILYIALWALFGTARMTLHFMTKGRLTAATKDLSLLHITFPYMMSAVAAAVEFDMRTIIPSLPFVIIGLLFFIGGSVIQFSGVMTLRNFFSNAVELRQKHAVISSGIYSLIRHPIYLGILLQSVASPFLLNVRIAVLFIIWATIGIFLRIRNEERFLCEHLDGYADYRKRTSALVPGIF